VFNVVAHDGNPDLYGWRPLSDFRPQYTATGSGIVDALGFWLTKMDRYLVEVKAEGDSRLNPHPTNQVRGVRSAIIRAGRKDETNTGWHTDIGSHGQQSTIPNTRQPEKKESLAHIQFFTDLFR
jgi:hypothetical protein